MHCESTAEEGRFGWSHDRFFYPQNHKLELYILSQILSLTDSIVLENSYEEQSNPALPTPA